jgi:hypothetical protein
MSRTNDMRARDAERCLDLLASLTGKDARECCISDLIAHLGHYCDRHDMDFRQLLVIAIGHWKLEQTDPESDGIPPLVTITIDGEDSEPKLKTYRVRIAESIAYDLEVEASDEGAAEIAAEELFLAMTDQERDARFALARGDLDILEMEEV